MKMITVLLVDDHSIVRDGLRLLLEAEGDIHVVGEAENGLDAIREAARLQPGVVLLDVAMPILNGIEAARQIAQVAPTAKVLILSSYNDPQHVRDAIRAGVVGYVMKESAANELLDAVRTTRGGDAFFSPPVSKQVLQQRARSNTNNSGGTSMPPSLTSRQVEVLQLIAEGYSNKQIGYKLCLSRKTIEKHRQKLMECLDLHSAAALTKYAVAAGIIESGRIPDSFPPLPSRPFHRSRHAASVASGVPPDSVASRVSRDSVASRVSRDPLTHSRYPLPRQTSRTGASVPHPRTAPAYP